MGYTSIGYYDTLAKSIFFYIIVHRACVGGGGEVKGLN